MKERAEDQRIGGVCIGDRGGLQAVCRRLIVYDSQLQKLLCISYTLISQTAQAPFQCFADFCYCVGGVV